MDIRSLLLRAGALMLLLLPLGACDDECEGNLNALPRADFRYSNAPEEAATLSGVEILGIGAPGDAPLTEDNASFSDLYLPFRIDSDTTRYILRTPEAEHGDTVTFAYTRTPRLVSAPCGVSYLFTISSISWSGEAIDSVVCPQGYIDNAATVSLHFYLRPGAFD